MFPLLDHIKSAFIEVNDLCPLCSYKFPLSLVNEYAKNNGIFCLPVCHKIFCQQNVTYRYTSQTSMANAGMNLGTIYFMLFMLPCLFLSATKLLPLWVPSSYTLKCVYNISGSWAQLWCKYKYKSKKFKLFPGPKKLDTI